jgi:hypothetical protein
MRTAALPGCAAPDLSGCGLPCRTSNRGNGTASRRNRLPAVGVRGRGVARQAVIVGQGIGQRSHVHRLGGVDLGRGAAAHEQGLATPLIDDLLAGLDGGEIDFGRSQGQRRGRRIHLVDEGPGGDRNAHTTHGARRHIKEIASRCARVTDRSCHWVHP